MSVQVSGQTALSEETQRDGGVYRRILSFAGFSSGLLGLSFLGTETALLTEIQVLDSEGNNLLGPLLDTSRFDMSTGATVVTTATAETTTTSAPATSSSAGTYQPTYATSVTSLNSTTPAVIAAVLGVQVAGLLLLLLAALLLLVVVCLLLLLLAAPLVVVVCLLVRRRRKEEAKRIRHMIELGIYDPINKQRTNDPYYELPVGVATEEMEYAKIEVQVTIISY